MATSSPNHGSFELSDTFINLEDTPMDTFLEVPSGGMDFEELKSKLQEIYLENTAFETRKSLLQTLVNENLATRDIYSFIKNQAQLRLVDKRLDNETLKQAMKTKISDLKTSCVRGEERKKKYEIELRKSFGNKRHKFRRCIKTLKSKAGILRRRKLNLYRKKIRHYREVQKESFMTN